MNGQVDTHGRGVLGSRTNNPVTDAGTMARAQNRPNMPEGAAAGGATGSGRLPASVRAHAALEEDRAHSTLDYIWSAKHADGSPFTLDELVRTRDQFARWKEQSIANFGPQSTNVFYFQELIERYDRLIARAKSPLNNVTKQAKEKNSSVTDEQLKQAIATELAEQKKQVEAGGEAPSLSGVVEAANLIAARRESSLKDLIQKAKLAGNTVSDEQITNAVKEDLEADRERQLLGGEGSTMSTVLEAVTVLADRKEAALKDVIRKAKLPGSAVSDEQMTKAVREHLEAERARQLLGGEGGSLALVSEAVNVFADRKSAVLKDLLKQAKVPGNTVKDEQLTKAVQDYLGAERQRQLLGAQDSGMDLIVETMKVVLDRKKAVVDELFKKSNVPGSGVTDQQIQKALADYESAKQQARKLGMSVPEGNVRAGEAQVGGAG